MISVQKQTVEHILLHGISWETYETLLREIGESHLRLTYDDGDLEIMTISFGHEHAGSWIGRLIFFLAFELNMALCSGGSTTFKDEALEKGIEPDKCWWIQNERKMRAKRKFEINVDPPPDLSIEVEVTRSALDRMGIYAALRIPEVWRCDGKTLRVYHLAANGKYRERSTSRAFPFLPMAKLLEFLQQAETVDETTLMRSFAKWVREELAPLVEKPADKSKSPRNGKRSGK